MSLGRMAQALGARARPELPWISRVAGCTPDRAQSALGSIAPQARVVAELNRSIRQTGRSYYAQFPAPLDLYALVRLSGARCIVESGVASGVSSTFILLGIETNHGGVLHSIDSPMPRRPKGGNEPWALPSGMSSGWAVPLKLRRGWDLRQGRSEELLKPLLAEVGTIDFYCHDSPVDIRHFEFEMKTIRGYLGPGSLVVADNTDRDVFSETAKAMGTTAFYRRESSLGAFRVPQGVFPRSRRPETT